ncbi:MAG: hypothetical protein ACRYGK_17680 [Janthinobacterium lividum]
MDVNPAGRRLFSPALHNPHTPQQTAADLQPGLGDGILPARKAGPVAPAVETATPFDPQPPARISNQMLSQMLMAPENAHLEFQAGSAAAGFLSGDVERGRLAFNAMLRTLLNCGKFDALNWAMLRSDAFIELTSRESVERIVDWLRGSPPVQDLQLTMTTWSAQEVASFARTLRGLTSLSTLTFARCLFDASGFAELAAGLSGHPTLSFLAFRDSCTDDQGLALLAPVVGTLPRLEKLHLQRNGLEAGAGAKDLFAALTGHAVLQALRLDGNQFFGPALPPVVDMLVGNRSLLELNLKDNALAGDDARVLAEGLRKNSTLVKLDVSSNAMAAGVLDLLAACSVHAGMRDLEIGSARLRTEHVHALGQALAANGSLRRVGVEWGMIPSLDDHDFIALAHNLRGNQTLIDLNLATARKPTGAFNIHTREEEAARDTALSGLNEILRQNRFNLPLQKIAAYLDLLAAPHCSAFRDINTIIACHYRLAASAETFNTINKMMTSEPPGHA